MAKGAKIYHNTTLANPPVDNNTDSVDKSAVYVDKQAETVEKPYRTMLANISAYTADSDECGKADGITASGVVAEAGRTIAMDGVPFGTEVEIDGHVYVVEDRFGGGYSDRIDIFMDTKAEAFAWGRRYLEVKIYE